MNLKFDEEAIRLINLFETLTGISVKDCVIGDNNEVFMLIEEGKLGLAIGKNGKNIKRVENLVKKNIKVFEFSPDINIFIKRVIPGINKLNLEGNKLEIWVEKSFRPVVIGREKKNLSILKKILERNFGIREVVVR
jgi:N utilization substance protein A